jgi:cell wall assembly regulator SMI1
MQDIWNRFEAWLDKNANQLLDDLNEGVDPELFESLERMMGVAMPDDFKEFYSIHNGQDAASEDRLFGVEELYSVERMLEERKKWKTRFDAGEFDDLESEPDDAIRSEWWNPYWLPITGDGNGNHYCIDFAPTRDGQLGQIIRMLSNHPKRKLVAPSLRQWMETYLIELEKGLYNYSPKWGGMVARSRTDYSAEESLLEDSEEDDFFDDEDGESLDGFEILDESDFE